MKPSEKLKNNSFVYEFEFFNKLPLYINFICRVNMTPRKTKLIRKTKIKAKRNHVKGQNHL